MKHFFKVIMRVLMRGLSIIYPYRFGQRLKAVRTSLYTQWVRSSVGSIGEGSSIGYPCTLQGGGLKKVAIGKGSRIQPHAVIECWSRYGDRQYNPSIVIGDNCNIGEYNHFSAIKGIMIGDGLLTGRFVYIGDNSHGSLNWDEADVRPELRELRSKGDIRIGNNVWIGDKCTILAGVHIGNNVVIGANSVVTHDVPSNCIACGAPATISKCLEPSRR